jgi:lipid-binding SYLF domain-containing protein
MRYSIFKIIFIFAIFISNYNYSYSDNKKKTTSIQLLHSSEKILKKLVSNPEFENINEYIKNARAILIFPEVYEGGFIFGAKGGNGLLLVRRLPEEFSGPYFYSIGGLSVGLQLGAKSGRVVMTIMTNRGLTSLLKERVKLGVDIDTAIIKSGVGYSAESTLRLADVYSFSDNSGLFVGGSFEGTYLQPRNDLNRAYHGSEFSSDQILDDKSISKDLGRLTKILNRVDEYKRKE